MRRRIYVNGKPDWSENEPGYTARVQGYGGSALGHFSGTTLTTPPRQKPKTERRLEQGREASKRYRERMRTQ